MTYPTRKDRGDSSYPTRKDGGDPSYPTCWQEVVRYETEDRERAEAARDAEAAARRQAEAERDAEAEARRRAEERCAVEAEARRQVEAANRQLLEELERLHRQLADGRSGPDAAPDQP